MNPLELQVLIVVSGVPENVRGASLLDWAARAAQVTTPGRPLPIFPVATSDPTLDEPLPRPS